ncbi:hypothetical protein QYF36_011368 [Acer negundo]|nr:hypothetical protein QYF36_011368 [Acer negundo]
MTFYSLFLIKVPSVSLNRKNMSLISYNANRIEENIKLYRLIIRKLCFFYEGKWIVNLDSSDRGRDIAMRDAMHI